MCHWDLGSTLMWIVKTHADIALRIGRKRVIDLGKIVVFCLQPKHRHAHNPAFSPEFLRGPHRRQRFVQREQRTQKQPHLLTRYHHRRAGLLQPLQLAIARCILRQLLLLVDNRRQHLGMNRLLLGALHGLQPTLRIAKIARKEIERRRIAGDLHDGVVQDLAAVGFMLSAAADTVGADQEPLHSELVGAASATRRGIQQLRTLLVDIYPPNLQKAGLARALADLLAPVARNGIATELDCPVELRLDPDSEGLVYRTAQEALRNVVKHSRASHVELALRGDGPTLIVRDDGAGFDPLRIDGVEDGHFGLHSLADLARSAGADLDIVSHPGHGTTVTLALKGTS